MQANAVCYWIVSGAALLVATAGWCGRSDITPTAYWKVETKLINQSYCRSYDGEVGTASFELNVKIHNEDNQPLLLCKKYVELACPVLSFAKPDGTVGDVAYQWNCDSVYAAHVYANFRKDYVIVPPGGNFNFAGSVGVFFRTPGSHPNPRGLLTSGAYWLHPFVDTWAGTPKAAAILRGKWRKRGELISDTLRAEPILVTVEVPENSAECK